MGILTILVSLKIPKYILPTIVVAQFFCTSLWFAGNAVLHDLSANLSLGDNAIGYLTSSVQLGFIVGTLLFALLSIADRFSPSRVFFFCAIGGAFFNLGMIWEGNTLLSIVSLRFLTGFFLAGIYPVGMKIAADYFERGLGKSLGFLVGALVLGTAFPHLLKDIKGQLPWESVIISTSGLAILGGLFMLFLIPDGPFRKPSQKLQWNAIGTIFKNRAFRSGALGYFGHMWELYAFWAFVPILIQHFAQSNTIDINTSFGSFLVIAIGTLGCIVAGYLAHYFGDKKIARTALFLSCLCCLIAPLILETSSPLLFFAFLLFWGFFVIADSPLFSTLVAQSTPPELRGTALTIVNSIGFFITIISIELLSWTHTTYSSNAVYMLLALGPIIGVIRLLRA